MKTFYGKTPLYGKAPAWRRNLLGLSLFLAVFGVCTMLGDPIFGGEELTTTSEAVEPIGEAAPAEKLVATPQQEADFAFNTAIMFLCAVLVIFMQAGFAMLEVGLNAAKNTINILFKNIMDLSVGVLLFFLVGFGLMYPGSAFEGQWFGFGGMGIGGLGMDSAVPTVDQIVNVGYSLNADFLFQVAFAATAATIVSGAVAGRMQFKSYLIYSAILTGLIYPISGMWRWGGGWLTQMGENAAGETIIFHDFAGSVIVHAVGGFAGLAGAIALGPRIGRFIKGKSVPMPGHNVAFAALGVFILWVGWYGFNPGSQLTYAGAAGMNITAYIAVTTTLSASAGAFISMLLAWVLFGKPDVTMALNGALAGLVGITANCDQVSLSAALAIGAVAGVLVVIGIVALDKLRIDDPVGAFPVHGLCGVWGGIATGIFGTATTMSMGVQILGTLVIAAWAFSTMLVLFLILKACGILRVSPEEETRGLDISEHGMHAYPQSQLIDDHYAPAPTETIGASA